MHLGGAIFDLFNIAVALADSITDVLVAAEFHSNGQDTFFTIVLVILILASVVQAVTFGTYLKIVDVDEPYTLLFVPLLAPVGLLLPHVCYVLTRFGLVKNLNISPPSEVDWKQAEKDLEEALKRDQDKNKKTASSSPTSFFGDAAASVFKSHQSGQSAVALIDSALRERFKTMLCLNLESLIESMPMIIVQLIAVSRRGLGSTPSVIQSTSLLLSIASVSCKLWQAARSATAPVWLAKISFMATDLFVSLFIYSVLLNPVVGDASSSSSNSTLSDNITTTTTTSTVAPTLLPLGPNENVHQLFGQSAWPVHPLSAAYFYVKTAVVAVLAIGVVFVGWPVIMHDTIYSSSVRDHKCLRCVKDTLMGFVTVILTGPWLVAVVGDDPDLFSPCGATR